MKILIDGRFYGPEHTGNGRYTMELVDNLARIDNKNKYAILLRDSWFNKLNLPENWLKIRADFKHYSFSEQYKLPFIIAKCKPDIVHFTHFNVPLFYFGKYIVTIHDLIMHKSKGGEATTRTPLHHLLWRLGYYLVFAKAVFGSVKIIVPSNFVKKDLIDYYKVSEKKVNVIYE
jgi:glycosyltransferase involved in cell wall biosynthesis